MENRTDQINKLLVDYLKKLNKVGMYRKAKNMYRNEEMHILKDNLAQLIFNEVQEHDKKIDLLSKVQAVSTMQDGYKICDDLVKLRPDLLPVD